MGLKYLLLLVIFFAVGVLVLPSTVSLFAGQHYWYNLSGERNDVPCIKCHADIADELSLSIQTANFHDFDGDGKASNGDCEACHRGNESIQYAVSNASVAEPGREAHAATLIECMYCHSQASNAPEAGGFGLTGNASDTGTYAAHREFAHGSRNSSLLLAENEACIACHTQIELRFNYTTVKVMGIEINETYSTDGTSATSTWTFTQAGNITYRITTADRTVKGSYGVMG